MLRRAAISPFRTYATPRSLASPPLLQQSRLYSSKGKPQKPYNYQAPKSDTASRHGPSGKRPNTSTASRSSRPPPIDPAGLEEKFRNIDEEIKNTEQSKPRKTSSSPDYSTLQDEFQTSAPSDHNTAPQSSSPPATDPTQPPRRPLPNLIHGIPSTLDAELEGREAKAQSTSLNITEEPSGGRGGQGPEIPRSEYISSQERKRTRIQQTAYTLLLGAILGTALYEGRNWENAEEEKQHPEAPSGWGLGLFYKRVKARMSDTSSYYTDPTFTKLLPDPDPMWARPYTLVISMEDLLVHSEWTREHGWRTAKRPGVDYFLRYLSSYYELVIWTDSQSVIGQQVYAKLDPYRVVLWPLFREATKYEKGTYVKDIAYLNRDPKKVIVLDTDPAHVKNQPENAIVIPPWTGQLGDKGLVSYVPFLEYCASMNYKDLREVLQSFRGEHIPTAYARREAAIRAKVQQQRSEQGASAPKRKGGLWGSLSGDAGGQLIGPDGTPLPTYAEASKQGKTYMDMVRERGQKQYEMLEKEIRENGEKWLKEMADDEKRQQDEAVKGMKTSLTGFIPFSGSDKGSASNGQQVAGKGA